MKTPPPIYQWKKDCESVLRKSKKNSVNWSLIPKHQSFVNKSKTWNVNLFLSTSLWKITKDVFKFMRVNFMMIKGEKIMKTLECSSKGDKRFCSFYAFVDFDGKYKSIETHFQDCKRNKDNKPCQKGEWATHLIICGQKLPTSDLTAFYRYLWYTYLRSNPDLVDYASEFKAFNNMYRGNSKNCPSECVQAYVKHDRAFYAPILQLCKKLNITL